MFTVIAQQNSSDVKETKLQTSHSWANDGLTYHSNIVQLSTFR